MHPLTTIRPLHAADRQPAVQRRGRLPSSHSIRIVRGIVLTVVAVDLGSKSLVARTLPSGQRAGLLHPMTNPEFSLGVAGTHPTLMVMVMVIGIVSAAALSLRLLGHQRITPLAAGLALGGGVANTADRLLNGAVRDFLITGPVVINLADLAVLIGLALATHSFLTSTPAQLRRHAAGSSGSRPERRGVVHPN